MGKRAGEQLKAIRGEKSQRALAREKGVSHWMLRKIESGEPISLSTAEKYGEVFGIPLDDFEIIGNKGRRRRWKQILDEDDDFDLRTLRDGLVAAMQSMDR